MKRITLAVASLALLAPAISNAHHNGHWNEWQAEKYEHRAERHERKAEKHLKKAKQHIRLARRNELQAISASAHSTRYAQVVSVQPVYFDCPQSHGGHGDVSWVEVRDRRHNGWVPVLTGGVLGGVVGYHIGGAHGEPQVGAIVGSAVGAGVGHGIAVKLNETRYIRVGKPGRHFDHHDHGAHQVKYLVTYRYNGRLYREHMDYHPGSKVKVRVNVAAA